MAYTRQDTTVSFSYDRDELFDACTLQSSYLSRTIKDQQGQYAGDNLVLTGDERDAFDQCLQGSVGELCGRVAKMCAEGGGALDMEDEVVVKMYSGSGDERAFKLADRTMWDAIVYGTLKSWFVLCGAPDLSEYCARAQSGKLDDLWRALFTLRNRA